MADHTRPACPPRICLVLTIAICCELLATGRAVAGPPFVTDDPDPVELGKWEVNYGLTGIRAMGMSSGSVPGFDINYGFAPNIQLHAQPQVAYVRGNGANATGLGDTELGVKYRFMDRSDAGEWMVATYPMLELPTGNKNRQLGAGDPSLYVPIWFQKTEGRWTTFGGGGYRFNSGKGNRNAWAGGWTAMFRVRENVQLGGEVFGSTPATNDGVRSVGVNFGGVVTLGGHASLLFSLGRGVLNATSTNQRSVYLGLRLES